jgi:DNA (cytosine-5)-methyltransferase 1
MMRFGSVCSGIEAASVAWHPLGWKAAWLSEIEPFPSAVLKHHYPDVPNLGDMTTLPERILSGEIEAPDVFCGGTPCQAFSVAGLRKSLDDARGNLSLTFVGIANAIDHVRSVRSDTPAIIFWENVPGVLSTSDNAFGCFLGALAGEDEPIIPSGGKWTNAGCVFGPQRAVAWRVLDAQYFGVAQRRRRVFVVASARDNFNPAAVLFEFDGVRRDSAPSREARKEVTAFTSSSIGGYSEGCGTLRANGGDLGGGSETLIAKRLTAGSGQRYDLETDTFLPMPINTMVALRHEALGEGTGFGIGEAGDPSYTLTKGHSHAVAQPVNIYGGNKRQDRPEGGFYVRMGEDTTKTLDAASGLNPTCSQGGTAVMQPIAPALTASNDPSRSPQSSEVTQQVAAVHAASMAVRRLTPVECERLQGFSDNYTNIPWRNKPESPDGPRYKALGNSWAVPVVRWIGKRINEAVK